MKKATKLLAVVLTVILGMLGTVSALAQAPAEPVTIRVAVQRDVSTTRKSLNEVEYLKELAKKMNVNIVWEEYSSSEWKEKVNLMFVSGNLPDAFFGEGISDLTILSNLDYFVPLNSLIDQYGENIKASFQEDPNILKTITAADGNIYSLFRYRGSYFPNTIQMMAINQEWLNTLGLQMPKTTEELYNVLAAFRDKDPNGNGIKDEIPLINLHGMGNTNLSEDWVYPAFGVYDHTSYDELTNHMMAKDGKAVFTPATEGYKEAVSYLNRLYSEGLLDAEMFTGTTDSYNAKMQDQAKLVGTFTAWTISNGVGYDRVGEYSQLLPLAGPKGDIGQSVMSDIMIGRNMFEITTANQHPEETMRWIDQFYSEDISIQTFYGPYGIMTERKADGTVTCWNPPEGTTYGTWRWGNIPADSAAYYCPKRFEQFLTPAKQQYDRAVYQQAVEPWLQPQESQYPNVFFSLDQVNTLKKIVPDINSYCDIMLVQFVTEGVTDESFDAYVAQLNSMGLGDALNIWQAAYDTFYGK